MNPADGITVTTSKTDDNCELKKRSDLSSDFAPSELNVSEINVSEINASPNGSTGLIVLKTDSINAKQFPAIAILIDSADCLVAPRISENHQNPKRLSYELELELPLDAEEMWIGEDLNWKSDLHVVLNRDRIFADLAALEIQADQIELVVPWAILQLETATSKLLERDGLYLFEKNGAFDLLQIQRHRLTHWTYHPDIASLESMTRSTFFKNEASISIRTNCRHLIQGMFAGENFSILELPKEFNDSDAMRKLAGKIIANRHRRPYVEFSTPEFGPTKKPFRRFSMLALTVSLMMVAVLNATILMATLRYSESARQKVAVRKSEFELFFPGQRMSRIESKLKHEIQKRKRFQQQSNQLPRPVDVSDVVALLTNWTSLDQIAINQIRFDGSALSVSGQAIDENKIREWIERSNLSSSAKFHSEKKLTLFELTLSPELLLEPGEPSDGNQTLSVVTEKIAERPSK